MTKKYGVHGGQYMPEILMEELERIEKVYNEAIVDEEFLKEFNYLLKNYVNRPSLLYYAENLSKMVGGAKIYLKREDLNHTGAHKINNVVGQALIAKRMGKKRLIAETGAGQHGVATATIAALMGMECEVFMGEEDTIRQSLNVYRMKLLGAKVHAIKEGTRTLKDAVNATIREFASRFNDTFYLLGSALGPHPYPEMVKFFQSVISKESKQQILQYENKLPKAIIACVGGGSNAIGAFAEYIEEKDVRLIGIEPAGLGLDTEYHAATLTLGEIGIFHGMKSYFLQDDQGQIAPVYSISAGLDYPGIGPEHSYLKDSKRAEYYALDDEEAVKAFELLAKMEGIIPAIESSFAVSKALEIAKEYTSEDSIIVNLSGRGDKDVAAIARYRGENINE